MGHDEHFLERLDRTALGQPTHLLFGVSAEDAMCIVTGVYYE